MPNAAVPNHASRKNELAELTHHSIHIPFLCDGYPANP